MDNRDSLLQKYFEKLEQFADVKMDNAKQDTFCKISSEIELILDQYVILESEMNSMACPFNRYHMSLNFFENYINPIFRYQNNQITQHFLRQRIHRLSIKQIEKQMFIGRKQTCPIKKIIDYAIYNEEHNFSKDNDLLIQQILDEYSNSFEYHLYNEIQNLADSKDRVYHLQSGASFHEKDIGNINVISSMDLYNRVLRVYSEFLELHHEQRWLNVPANCKRINELKENEFVQVAQEFFELEFIFKKRQHYSFNENMGVKLLTIFQTDIPISELHLGDFLNHLKSIIKDLVTVDLLFFFISELVNQKFIRPRSNKIFYERFNEIAHFPVGNDAIKNYVSDPTKISQRIKKSLDKDKLIELRNEALITLQKTNKNRVVIEILRKIKDINV